MESDSSPLEPSEAPVADPPPPISPDEAKQTEGESNQAHSVELTTVEVSAPAEVATEASAEVVPLTGDARRFPGKSTEEIAAIKIQTAFRGYLVQFIPYFVFWTSILARISALFGNLVYKQ